MELLLLYPGGGAELFLLGHDVLAGQQVQLVVHRGVRQGARLRAGGRGALPGAGVAPGYSPEDVSFGKRETLLAAYPEQEALIKALTRGGGS